MIITLGLVCEQEAKSVADKSEYIWEGYAFKKTVKGLKYRKQKKGNWMFCKIYKENQKELEKCMKKWNLIYSQNKQGKINFLSTINTGSPNSHYKGRV